MKHCMKRFVLLFIGALCLSVVNGYAQETTNSPQPTQETKPLTLVEAVICEGIDDYIPQNPGVVFSTSIGKILCVTVFDPVPQDTAVYHNWYRNDNLINKTKLKLKTPRWSTFSSIQLREADKGPWRVEIVDQKGRIHKILRFSITD